MTERPASPDRRPIAAAVVVAIIVVLVVGAAVVGGGFGGRPMVAGSPTAVAPAAAQWQAIDWIRPGRPS
jgi:hypothetical protein